MRSTLHLVSSADYPTARPRRRGAPGEDRAVVPRRPRRDRRAPPGRDRGRRPQTWDDWRSLAISLANRPIRQGEIWPLWTVGFMHARLVHLPPSGSTASIAAPGSGPTSTGSAHSPRCLRRRCATPSPVTWPRSARRRSTTWRRGSGADACNPRGVGRASHRGRSATRQVVASTTSRVLPLLRRHAGSSTAAPQVGLAAARVCASRAEPHPAGRVPQACDRTERRRRADVSRRRLRRRHWKVDKGRFLLEPFARLPASTRRELEAEGERLLGFLP